MDIENLRKVVKITEMAIEESKKKLYHFQCARDMWLEELGEKFLDNEIMEKIQKKRLKQ